MVSSLLNFEPASIELPTGHFIQGRIYEDSSEEVIQVYSPSDGRYLSTVPDAGAATVDFAVQNAARAARVSGWSTCAPRERAKALHRWADLIEKHKVPLSQLEAVCSTRPVFEAHSTDIPFTAEAIRFFAEYADKIGGDVAATKHDSLGFIITEPYGVVGAITPWNFPLSMCSWKCGPALAAGNAVVLKPSELTPFSTMKLAKLAIEAGIPAGIFNVINGYGPSAGAALTRHPLIGKLSFTGSTRTGGAIMSEAAMHGIKPVTLELGGKSPQLVFENVSNIEHTAACVARGFIGNGGQTCVAGTRLLVQKKIADALLDKVKDALESISPGQLWDHRTRYSPIISASQADRVATLVETTRKSGAEILCGGGFFETRGGYFYRPTLLGNLRNDSPAVLEEIFGPVLTVQTFDTEEEGIALASHPIYGLAAGVHTSDIGQAMRAMRRIAAGTVWINRYGRSADFIIPTGGFQQSGIGKDLGKQAIEGCLRHKSVLIDF